MFVCVTTYLAEIPPDSPALHEHWSYLDGRLAAGELVCSGPQTPRTGGVLVLRVADRDAAERFVQADPLVRDGFVSHQLIEFTPTRSILSQ